MRQNLGAILQSSMRTCIRQLKYAILERVCHFFRLQNIGDYVGKMTVDRYAALMGVCLHIFCLSDELNVDRFYMKELKS